MSNTIDLTAESPPRPPLTLPGSYANNAAAGPSVSSSRATAAPQPSPAAPNSGRHTRQTLLQRRRNAAPGGGIGLLADTNLDTASLPELFVAPGQHSSPQNNDDFEFVGMSEGARLASEAAQRDAENARVWRQNFVHEYATGAEGSGRQTTRARPAPPTMGIRDNLPPGPHARLRGVNAAAAAGHAFPTVLANDQDDAQARAVRHRFLPDHGATFAELFSQMQSMQRRLFGFVRPAGPADVGQGSTEADMPAIPSKHNRSLVLNRSKERPDNPMFTHSIVEPPVDVETYDQDPRIITGPLPDNSAICAGCDCALVRGGLGKRKLWAFPCGHVFDARCYDRYCSGTSAKQARQLAREDIKEEEQGALAAISLGQVSSTNDAPKPSADAVVAAGAKRLVSEMEPDTVNVPKAEGQASDAGRVPVPSPAVIGPRKSARLEASAATAHSLRGDVDQIGEVGESDPSSPKSIAATLSKPVPKVQSFKCPVEGCNQRVSTAPGKPASAVELYM